MALLLAMLIAVELGDAAADRATGKRTWVVRLGHRRAARLYSVFTLAAFAALPGLIWLGLPATVAALIAACAPLALRRALRMTKGDWQRPNEFERIAFWSVVVFMAVAIAELG